jgi:serine/threonine protein kinase
MQDFQVIQQIGSGSFGSVYKVKSLYTGEILCMKKINFQNDDAILKNIQKESHLWYNLSHPNIVKYIKSFVEQDYYCIVMELIDGLTLDQFLLQHPNLNEIEILDLFLQLLNAVKYVHDNEVLHRDIKPQNILLTKENQIK